MGWSGPTTYETGEFTYSDVGESGQTVATPILAARPEWVQFVRANGLEVMLRDLGWMAADVFLVANGGVVAQFSSRPSKFDRVMGTIVDIAAPMVITAGISAAVAPVVAAAELPAVVSQVATRAGTSTIYAAATDRPIDVGNILEAAVIGQARSEVLGLIGSILTPAAPVFVPFEELEAPVFEPAPAFTFELPPMVELPQVFEPLPVFEPAQPVVVEPVPIVQAAPELEPVRVEPPVIQAPIEFAPEPEPQPPVPVTPSAPPAAELLDLPPWAFEAEQPVQIVAPYEQWQLDAPTFEPEPIYFEPPAPPSYEPPAFVPPPMFEPEPIYFEPPVLEPPALDLPAFEPMPTQPEEVPPMDYYDFEPPPEYFMPYEAPPAEDFYYTPPEVYGSADVMVEPPPVSFGGEERLPTDLPPYEYGAPQAPEAPIPTVTYTPPAPTSREWSVEQVITTVTRAADQAIKLVRAWETRKLPANPVARATDAQGRTVLAKGDGMVYTRDTQGRVSASRPAVGLPQTTVDGFVIVNNGDGTFTRITPSGARETLRYAQAAPGGAGAGVGLLVVAGIAAFALMG
jgi:hypothetical protein